jgi:hypothetical protein
LTGLILGPGLNLISKGWPTIHDPVRAGLLVYMVKVMDILVISPIPFYITPAFFSPFQNPRDGPSASLSQVSLSLSLYIYLYIYTINIIYFVRVFR